VEHEVPDERGNKGGYDVIMEGLEKAPASDFNIEEMRDPENPERSATPE
jgi:hypothetical protein